MHISQIVINQYHLWLRIDVLG